VLEKKTPPLSEGFSRREKGKKEDEKKDKEV